MESRTAGRGNEAYVSMVATFPAALVFAAVAVGAWARLRGLGAAPLAVDEYYLATSVQNILERGLPQFDCGGFYTRGLLHQYATAALLQLGIGPMELALRLPSVAADAATVAGAWLLARHLGGRGTAVLVAAMLCLSLWQIEFARFGRMYAIFQACTVFWALAALRCLESGETRYHWQMIGIAALAVVSHEGGVLLAAATVLLPLLAPRRIAPGSMVAAVALAACAVTLLLTPTRFLGVESPWPEDLLRSAPRAGDRSLPFDLPSLHPPTTSAWLLLAAAVCWAHIRRRGGLECPLPAAGSRALGRFFAAVAWVTVLASFALGQIVLGVLLLALAVAFRVLDAHMLRRRQVALPVALLAAGALLARTLQSGSALEAVRSALRYPDFYLEVLTPWSRVLPLLGASIALVAVAAGLLVLLARDRSEARERYRLLLAVTLALLAAAVLSRQPYVSTRYTYFLYPLLLILLVQGLALLCRGFAAPARSILPVGIATAAFLGSSDFGLRHALGVDRPEYLYRTAYDRRQQEHFFRRWDYRGVAAALERQARPGDLVISTAYPVMPHYTRLIDFVYLDRTDRRIWIVSGCGGRRDLWSNLPLVYSPEVLRRRIAESTATVWIVVSTGKYPARAAIERELLARYAGREVYRSIDGHLALLRIPPGGRP